MLHGTLLGIRADYSTVRDKLFGLNATIHGKIMRNGKHQGPNRQDSATIYSTFFEGKTDGGKAIHEIYTH